MDLIGIISLISAVLGIISFFLPDRFKSKGATIAVVIMTVTSLSIVVVSQTNRLKRINNISKAANKLLDRQKFDFSPEGFNLACLSFLEQNKDLYPESYERAQGLFKQSNGMSYENADTMSGLIRGIAILNDEESEK